MGEALAEAIVKERLTVRANRYTADQMEQEANRNACREFIGTKHDCADCGALYPSHIVAAMLRQAAETEREWEKLNQEQRAIGIAFGNPQALDECVTLADKAAKCVYSLMVLDKRCAMTETERDQLAAEVSRLTQALAEAQK